MTVGSTSNVTPAVRHQAGWLGRPDHLVEFAADQRDPHDERPWVLSNMVSTLDGSAVGPDGRSGNLAGPDDRHALVGLRSIADAIIVGAGTARTEHYHAPTFRSEIRAHRLQHGLEPTPLLVIISNSARFAPEATLERMSSRLVLAVPSDRVDVALGQFPDASVIASGDAQVNVVDVLAALHDRGVRVALTEGGPALLGSLLESDLIDEFNLTLTPKLSGGHRTPLTGRGSFDPQAWLLHRTLQVEDDLYLRYRRR